MSFLYEYRKRVIKEGNGRKKGKGEKGRKGKEKKKAGKDKGGVGFRFITRN